VSRQLAWAALLLLLVACGSDDGLTVFAAASLTDVLERIEPNARFNFAGSDELAEQIGQGAPADVYASADEVYARRLHADGLIEEPISFATNRLVLIVPRDNPAGILSVFNLKRPRVRVVIGAEGVPVGDYARRLLETLDASAVLENVVSEEQDVKGVAGKVAFGEADAGFVYATDVGAVAEDVIAIELPAAAQPEITYTIAIVEGTDDAEAADGFIDSVRSMRGRRLLREAGFGVP
jgi:molybdate transport system substrate-binding protein